MALSTDIYGFTTSKGRATRIYQLALIVVLGVLVYSNTLFSPFCFDDFLNILENPLVTNTGLSGLKNAFYSRRAIGIISFQLNYFISGGNVTGYHVTNIIIHIASALALYWMSVLVVKAVTFDSGNQSAISNFPLPFVVALLFVVHPVQTQAVTYIVQRFSSLATLFYLLAVAVYLSARLEQLSSGRSLSLRSGCWFALVPLFLFLAFYSKETAYTLPGALLLVELFFFKRTKWKIASIGAVSAVVATGIGVKLAKSGYSVIDTLSVIDGATRLQTITSRTDYLLTQFRVIVTYLRLLILPINQRLDYDLKLSHSFFEPAVFLSFLILLSLLAFAIFMLKKSEKTGNPYLKLASFGIVWFFLTLSIESSVIPIIDLIFEHRLYLPSVGAFIAATSVTMLLAGKYRIVSERVIFTGLLIISLVYAVVAFNRNRAWESEISIWTDSVTKSPLSARAWNNLGGAYIKKRDSRNSLLAIVRSIELDPSKADAWNNLGIAIDLLGVYNDRFRRTTEMFEHPGSVEPQKLNLWLGDVNNNLGLAYEILGNRQKALEGYRNAVGYNPSMGLAYYNQGILNAQSGNLAEAYVQVQILRFIDPALAERLQARAGIR